LVEAAMAHKDSTTAGSPAPGQHVKPSGELVAVAVGQRPPLLLDRRGRRGDAVDQLLEDQRRGLGGD
jgi:hypothetical protein